MRCLAHLHVFDTPTGVSAHLHAVLWAHEVFGHICMLNLGTYKVWGIWAQLLVVLEHICMKTWAIWAHLVTAAHYIWAHLHEIFLPTCIKNLGLSGMRTNMSAEVRLGRVHRARYILQLLYTKFGSNTPRLLCGITSHARPVVAMRISSSLTLIKNCSRVTLILKLLQCCQLCI